MTDFNASDPKNGRHLRGARAIFIAAHLWLGLTFGPLFALTGLTGSALVFYQEIDAVLNPQTGSALTNATPERYEAVYQTLKGLAPESDGYWSIEFPKDGGTITSRFIRPGIADRRLVSVDPKSLAVLRDTLWGGTAMTWIYDLHQQLLLPQIEGRALMGMIGFVLIFLMALGFFLWWPGLSGIGRSFVVAWAGAIVGKPLDIHRMIGSAVGILLIVLAATGAMIGLPSVTRQMLASTSVLENFPTPNSAFASGATRIPLDQALVAARSRFPGARIVWADSPNGPDGVYQIRMQQRGEPSPRFPRSYVWVDQYSGNVLASREAKGESAGDAVLTWLHPLHNGEAFGLMGRIVVFLLGLIPFLLFASGAWQWLSRKGARLLS